MTEYRCPNCTGGFPAEALDDDRCPWCGLEFGDAEAPPTISTIARKDKDGEDKEKGLLGVLKG